MSLFTSVHLTPLSPSCVQAWSAAQSGAKQALVGAEAGQDWGQVLPISWGLPGWSSRQSRGRGDVHTQQLGR